MVPPSKLSIFDPREGHAIEVDATPAGIAEGARRLSPATPEATETGPTTRAKPALVALSQLESINAY